MTSSAPEHTADEAGGEAIFSSDGLPSLVGLLPPPLPTVASRISGTGRDENDDAVIEDDSGVDPRVAFETFADRRNDDAGWSVLSSSGGGRSSGDETFSSADDPRRRLFRLRAEIDQLEAQLAEEGSATSTAARGAEEDALHSMALELKSRLDAMGIGGDFASLSTMIRGRQDDLSRVILRDLEKIAAGAKGDTADSKKEENQSGKIIYELFKESASMNASSSREAMLEQRLRKLETAMGVKGAEGEKSLLIRLEEAERLSKEVDAKEIEKIAAKAKVIR